MLSQVNAHRNRKPGNQVTDSRRAHKAQQTDRVITVGYLEPCGRPVVGNSDIKKLNKEAEMSLAKTAGMSYELTGTKTASKGNGKRVSIKAAQELSSGRLVWILVARHKVGILAAGNIAFVLNWALPMWPEFVKSIF